MLVRRTAPLTLPITLPDARAHLMVDGTDHDARIQTAIEAVTAHLDGPYGMLGQCMIDQSWAATFDRWPHDGRLLMPIWNTRSIAISYRDADLAQHGLPAAQIGALRMTVDGPVVQLTGSLPVLTTNDGAIEIVMTAGFGSTPADIPADIRAAMLLMIGDLFRFTETATMTPANAVPLAAGALDMVRKYRMRML